MGIKGAVVNLEETNRKMESKQKPKFKNPEDAIVIYELHVRDLSTT